MVPKINFPDFCCRQLLHFGRWKILTSRIKKPMNRQKLAQMKAFVFNICQDICTYIVCLTIQCFIVFTTSMSNNRASVAK
ncbi:CLUMA_CG006376, isoform A [Clunio marinus]|uniref:CLUMA_CG006376, isoform A n=1 Tax=Clunio marinus TaxID=568069 RepID=A0A1J1HZA8_9DIPT|nr:CLUMA_CG006376, isoform A [Clunio marinus]